MYSKYARLGILVTWLVFVSSVTFGQHTQLDTLRKRFDSFRKNSLQEKIYVHCDQDLYLTGETLWFKIYDVDGSFHKPLDLSKVVYLEILDKNNTSILHAKVSMKNGFGSGSLFIPATISSGNYTLRGYTRWMKNFDASFFYHKSITIVNTFVKPDLENPGTNTLAVELFPEGGHLVAGLPSKVGFRVTDNTGKGVPITGAILNGNNDTLTTFASLHAGIGHFVVTPSRASDYKVVIFDAAKNKTSHSLPPVQEEGYVMNLKTEGEDLVVNITHTFKGSEAFVYLFAHSRQVISHAEGKNISNGSISFKIDKKLLAEGITHFTLFDKALKPVCERLYFKYPKARLDIRASSDRAKYDTRRKVSVNVATTFGGQPAPANLSVSVCKLDSLSNGDEDGIFEYLWLSSDLRGKIENPEFYFSGTTDAAMAVDNLMLTHGWRKFSWDDVLQGNIKRPHPLEYRGHIVNGRVTDKSGNPASGSLTFLSSPSKLIRIFPARSNRNGEVKFETLDLWGSRKLITQSNDSTHTVTVENPLAAEYAPSSAMPFELSPAVQQVLTQRSIAMQVQDIYHDDMRSRFVKPKIDSMAFFGKADETYLLDDYTRFPVMEEVMREYVPGVFVRKRRDGFHFIVLDKVHEAVMQQTPLILLDGVPLFDADEIMEFDPRKVKKLEVVTKLYFMGAQTFYGIVSYTTYAGDLAGFRLDPKCVVIDYEGLHLEREFPTPRYENHQQQSARVPDQRNVLFWSPRIVVDGDGKHQIEFYTSDIEGSFLIKFEGITAQGVAGTGTAVFKVEQLDN